MPRLSDYRIPRRGNAALYATAARINDSYGRGDIVALYEGTRAPLTGAALCKLQYGTETANFRVIGNKLYFRGRRRVIRPA